MDIDLIQIIVNDQFEYYQNKHTGIPRDVDFVPYYKSGHIVVITGIRRSGKSTLMLQLAKKYNDYHYITFEDERFAGFTVDDFQQLLTILHKRSPAKILFFDEIQNIPEWERFVRRVHDQGYKIFISGSNANLLSSELATRLTGRYLKIELFPFSYKELLMFQNIEYNTITTQKKSLLLHYFDQYLNNGGFPDWLNTQNKEILQLIYDDIVYRDIIGRYGINEIKSFKQLSQFLSTNIAKEFSYNSLAKSLNIKSTTSVRNYVDYLQSAYLMYELYKYDYSLKKQFINQKKIYSIDNGLRNNISFIHTSDSGRLLENIVFIELKRRGENVFFYKGKNECDFLIHQSGKITTLLQVCYTINAVNETRELSGLIEAAKIFNLNSGIIITYDQCDTFIKEGIEINIVAIWKWLLNI